MVLIYLLFKNHTKYITNLLVYQKKYKIFATGEGRSRAAIVVTNNQMDTLLIKQLSDEDKIVLEVLFDNVKIIYASNYLDITQ
jgi:hypothetical protein